MSEDPKRPRTIAYEYDRSRALSQTVQQFPELFGQARFVLGDADAAAYSGEFPIMDRARVFATKLLDKEKAYKFIQLKPDSQLRLIRLMAPVLQQPAFAQAIQNLREASMYNFYFQKQETDLENAYYRQWIELLLLTFVETNYTISFTERAEDTPHPYNPQFLKQLVEELPLRLSEEEFASLAQRIPPDQRVLRMSRAVNYDFCYAFSKPVRTPCETLQLLLRLGFRLEYFHNTAMELLETCPRDVYAALRAQQIIYQNSGDRRPAWEFGLYVETLANLIFGNAPWGNAPWQKSLPSFFASLSFADKVAWYEAYIAAGYTPRTADFQIISPDFLVYALQHIPRDENTVRQQVQSLLASWKEVLKNQDDIPFYLDALATLLKMVGDDFVVNVSLIEVLRIWKQYNVSVGQRKKLYDFLQPFLAREIESLLK